MLFLRHCVLNQYLSVHRLRKGLERCFGGDSMAGYRVILRTGLQSCENWKIEQLLPKPLMTNDSLSSFVWPGKTSFAPCVCTMRNTMRSYPDVTQPNIFINVRSVNLPLAFSTKDLLMTERNQRKFLLGTENCI